MTTSYVNIVHGVLLLLVTHGTSYINVQQTEETNPRCYGNVSTISHSLVRQVQAEYYKTSFTLAPDFNPSTVTSICYHFSRRIHTLRYIKSKKIYKLSLLILSGDIALNPGPAKFPCKVCSKAVAKTHRAVQCDEC